MLVEHFFVGTRRNLKMSEQLSASQDEMKLALQELEQARKAHQRYLPKFFNHLSIIHTRNFTF